MQPVFYIEMIRRGISPSGNTSQVDCESLKNILSQCIYRKHLQQNLQNMEYNSCMTYEMIFFQCLQQQNK